MKSRFTYRHDGQHSYTVYEVQNGVVGALPVAHTHDEEYAKAITSGLTQWFADKNTCLGNVTP